MGKEFALNGGEMPVCAVPSRSKAEQVRVMGAELVNSHVEEDFQFWRDEGRPISGGAEAVRGLDP
ncbi:hypothetical protein [Polymorphospora rubra]|uniref:hypothetical protein n=1 Tax=Polymorphospora rubra TaxID=338584 RepID=UPI0033DDC9C3